MAYQTNVSKITIDCAKDLTAMLIQKLSEVLADNDAAFYVVDTCLKSDDVQTKIQEYIHDHLWIVKNQHKHFPRDPTEPKQPLTSYMKFALEERQRLKEMGMTNQNEISKTISQHWYAMTYCVTGGCECDGCYRKLNLNKEYKQRVKDWRDALAKRTPPADFVEKRNNFYTNTYTILKTFLQKKRERQQKAKKVVLKDRFPTKPRTAYKLWKAGGGGHISCRTQAAWRKIKQENGDIYRKWLEWEKKDKLRFAREVIEWGKRNGVPLESEKVECTRVH